jgi:hypothetical protein
VSTKLWADLMTSITFNFVGVNCEGCIVATQDVDSITIKNDTAVFNIATADTAGTYFSIDNPKFGFIDAATMIVMQ